MRDENSNYIGFVCFFLLIIIIVISGSVVLYKSHQSKSISKNFSNNETIINDKMKVETEEDFIYYVDEIVEESLSLVYKKAIINLNSEDAKTVNEILEKLVDSSKNSIIKSNSEENLCENGNEIFSYNSLDYSIYSYNEYLTLVVSENNNSCKDDLSRPQKIYSYTFDILTGKLISFDDLLSKYDITYTKVLEKIKNHLEEQQTIIDGVPTIKIDETINELKSNETYIIFFSETKKLVVKYIVKTNSVDYNDIIELN